MAGHTDGGVPLAVVLDSPPVPLNPPVYADAVLRSQLADLSRIHYGSRVESSRDWVAVANWADGAN
jgi:hypothetical protein